MSVVPRSYDSIHKILKRRRGPARNLICPCGQPAVEWAYQFTAGDRELRDDNGRFPHSLDIKDYEAMCRSCHNQLDLENGGGRQDTTEKQRDNARRMAESVNKKLRMCLQCGFISAPGPLGRHQHAYHHEGYEEVGVG